jgi:hypothetical protein
VLIVENNKYLQTVYFSGYEVWQEYLSNQMTITVGVYYAAQKENCHNAGHIPDFGVCYSFISDLGEHQ